MPVIVVTLWTVAAILILTNPKSKVNRWGSALAFFSGFAPFCTIFGTQIIQSIKNESVKDITWTVNNFLLSFPYNLAPYSYVMFCLYYTRFFQKYKRVWTFLPYILLIPVFYMYLTTPVLPKYKPDPLTSSVLMGSFILFGNILLGISYFKEKNKKLKKQTFFTIAVLAPSSLYSLLTNYVMRIFDINHLWKYSVIPGVITFLIFIVGLARFSVMGVRLKPEEYILEGTMKAFSSGMAILSHTLKNEINKISICINNIKQSLQLKEPDIQDAVENADIVLDSVDYLSKLISRLRKQIEEITILEEEKDLFKITEAAISRVKPFINQESIKVSILFSPGIKIKCDQLHIIEVMTNILKNSIEAMNKGGIVEISVYRNKKYVNLSISDTGEGILDENIDRILEPFYSTKSRVTNDGLGLSYCYSVMKKHDGNLEICSSPGTGTTVMMSFPKSRLLSMPENLP